MHDAQASRRDYSTLRGINSHLSFEAIIVPFLFAVYTPDYHALIP